MDYVLSSPICVKIYQNDENSVLASDVTRIDPKVRNRFESRKTDYSKVWAAIFEIPCNYDLIKEKELWKDDFFDYNKFWESKIYLDQQSKRYGTKLRLETFHNLFGKNYTI